MKRYAFVGQQLRRIWRLLSDRRRHRRQRRLKRLKGRVEWDGDLDEMRSLQSMRLSGRTDLLIKRWRVVGGYGLLNVLLVAGCDAVVTNEHAVLVEADRPFNHGWLPDIVPIESTEVVMHNDLDINISWGSFVLPQDEIDHFLALLEPLGDQEYRYHGEGSTWLFTVDKMTGRVYYRLVPAEDQP